MRSVEQAQELIAAEVCRAAPGPTTTVPLKEALGCVLAEGVVSDVDSPPHDKSIVDGYAIVAEGLAAGSELVVLEEVTAGALPTVELTAGTATRIMTGAPLPLGATGVVMVEKTEPTDSPVKVRILESPRSGQNIVRRGTSLVRGQNVLLSGQRLNPARIGLLAEVGRSMVRVNAPPSVAVLSTGNEIVPCDTIPGPSQIRNSNAPMLEALVQQAGARVVSLGICRDFIDELTAAVARGLEADFLVLSGGVSAGVLDLVPGVLAQLGVRQVFHKVNLKPGKPIWFGVFSRAGGHQTLVFGLPGNPVSSFVCFELFVRPALQLLMGESESRQGFGRLDKEHFNRGDRPTYWPAKWNGEGTKAVVSLLPWKGSGDLKTLAEANCLAIFTGAERLYQTGDEVPVRFL